MLSQLLLPDSGFSFACGPLPQRAWAAVVVVAFIGVLAVSPDGSLLSPWKSDSSYQKGPSV